jgi:predicted acylesterase/phospholipase RssA/Ca2+/Na+ antiporter
MMQRLRFAVAVVVSVLASHSLHASAPADCAPIANVVRIGIPRDRSDRDTTAAIRENLQLLYRDPCYGVQPLQIQNAYGSDYQMLEWLESGAIDGAIVTDFALWMLHQDGKLVELPQDAAGSLLAPLPRASLVATRRGGTWQTRDATTEYDRFLQQVWDTRDKPEKPQATLALASHLSTTGFLEPVSRAAAFFEARIGKKDDVDKIRTEVWKKFFASTRFTIDCTSIDDCLRVVAADRPALKDGPILYFPGEEVLRRAGLPIRSATAREHFVLSGGIAEKLFPPTTAGFHFVPVQAPQLPQPLADTLADPPSILRHIIEPEPMYGTRIYAFTPDESLRLLYQQQARSNEDELALVLPGGGVKAAYQTGIISTLYNAGQLWNDTKEPSRPNALAVRTVIGTSGGALLGFFTSQLRPREQIDLSKILWEKKDGSTLDSEDVFSFTDLPRYISIGAAFLIFALLLAFFSGLGGSKLCARGPTPQPSWRWRLVAIAALFFSAPLLVRHVLGEQVEHVPVIEGIFYSLMVVIILFVDHCIVDRGPGQHEKRPALRQAIMLGAVGLLLIAWALSSGTENGFLQQDVTFGAAFTLLGAFFVGAPLLMLYLGNKAGDLHRRIAETAVALPVVALLCAFGVPGWFPVAQLLGFLLLVAVALTVYFYTRNSQQAEERGKGERPWWMPPLLTGVTLFCTAMLCWPAHGPDRSGFALGRFADPSLGLKFGAFFASIGLIVLIFAVIILAYRDRRYGADNVDDFLWGLTLVLVHTALTIGAVFALSALTSGWVHTLEMTPSFWAALVAAAIVFALLLIFIATRQSRHPVVEKVRTGVRFLAAEHFNGSYVPRRYARVLLVMVFAVSWWNFVIAPAIYGNEVASNYIRTAIERFHETRHSAGFAPAARFIATANLLERDGTYFFVFHPEAEEAKAGSSKREGAVWLDYPTSSHINSAKDCRTRIDNRCRDFVRDVVFASGSPFPIFAAHAIEIPGEKRQWFVDGGYSNNIPVDAAKAVDAKQVLIVHSANPLEGSDHEKEADQHLWRPGQLVMNARRLPGFLFERSQQLDRLSRQNLFVVALAPPLELSGVWPNLAQFDRNTVDTMRRDAREHIGERIGMVESWGPPHFQVEEP